MTTSATSIRRTAEIINNFLYGKSGDYRADENQSPDFQDGFHAGYVSKDCENEWAEWTQEWERRGRKMSTGWEDWKRGFHAGRWEYVASRADQ